MSRGSFMRFYLFGSICFFVFLFLRFPDTRIKAYVLGVLTQEAQNQGIVLDVDGDLRLSFLPFPGITLERIRLKSLKNGLQGELKALKAELSLSSLLTGKVGAQIRFLQEKGHLDVFLAGRGTSLDVQFDADSFDLHVLPLVSMLAPVQVAAQLSGKGKVKSQNGESLEGEVQLDLRQIELPAQSLFGFKIPLAKIKSGLFSLQLEGKKIRFTKAQLGQFGTEDDLVAHFDQGSVTLGKSMMQTELDLRIKFQISPQVMASFPFVESMLRNAQRGDGSYGYALKGPVMGLQPVVWKE